MFKNRILPSFLPIAALGQFYLVLNGSLQHDGATYSRWSTIYLNRSDEPLAVAAGAEGMEALILEFPRAASQ